MYPSVPQMLTGLPPYYDTNVQRMYHKILHEPLKFPKGERYVRTQSMAGAMQTAH